MEKNAIMKCKKFELILKMCSRESGKFMLKKVSLLGVFLVVVVLLFGCEKSNDEQGELKVVTTLFPQYEFTKNIVGDKGSVTLLLPQGVESHTFDPTPKDMQDIYESQVFIYTGKEMEPWAGEIIKGVDKDKVVIVDASKNIELKEENHGDESAEEIAAEEEEHARDPHIWLDPKLAKVMIDNIVEGVVKADSKNEEYYRTNAEAYKAKLDKLDQDTKDVVSQGKKDTLVFGGRFAYAYFIEAYGLKYVTAYDSCSSEAEPSIKEVSEVIDYMRKENIHYIFHEELTDPKIANSIAKEVGGESLTFSTGHNVSKEEWNQGITYLEIMYANLENIRKALL